MHRFIAVSCSAVLLVLASAPAHGQTPPRPVEQAPAAGSTALPPLKIVVTASRYDGDKRISSLPYTLSVIPSADPNRGGTARLRMGTQVPVPSATTPKDGEVGFEDSSVFPDDRGRTAPNYVGQLIAPSIRSFSLSNQVILKDGQSAQFNTTPDKVTGEIVKLDISLSVVK
jgi:hypothetical protein